MRKNFVNEKREKEAQKKSEQKIEANLKVE